MTTISPKDGPVAVTGASGNFGGHMVRELILHGYQVRALIRDGSSWRGQDATAYLSQLPGVEVIDGCDLFVPGSFDAAFKGCCSVFHTAAVLGNSAGDQPLGTGDLAQDVYNGGKSGTQNVIDAVIASGTVSRVIYTSSDRAVVSGPKGERVPNGYEWTETDWADDEVDPEEWQAPKNAYARGKVDAERMLNAAADASGGGWDVVTFNPAMICGPVLFKAQVGQWIDQIGRMAGAAELTLSRYDRYYNIIDARDLAAAHRLAAESTVDHKATTGGPRYMMHGTGGRSALRFGTEVAAIISKQFPRFELSLPKTVTSSGQEINPKAKFHNDCKKAKSVLGVTIRPIEDTIRDVVESSIELGVVSPRLRG